MRFHILAGQPASLIVDIMSEGEGRGCVSVRGCGGPQHPVL